MSTARVTFVQNSGAVLTGRIWNQDGSDALRADISSITYTVQKQIGGTWGDVVGYVNQSRTVSTCVFDTLQAPLPWDATGAKYNFRAVVPAAAFATGGVNYRVIHKITPASGEVVNLVHQGPCAPIS
jgi:hypothetical protein